MALRHQLELGPREVVCLVGGGGKTTLMEALAREYEAAGLRAIATTTTKIMPPKPGARPLVLGRTCAEIRARLATMWGNGLGDEGLRGEEPTGHGLRDDEELKRGSAAQIQVPIVGTDIVSSGKLDGLPSEWIGELRSRGLDAIFVEADGAARLPLKAPAPYEPVIPDCATVVVAMAGLDAQCATLDDEHVHRASRVAELIGRNLGETLAPEDVLRVLVLGYQDRVPRQARLVVLLNKADAYPLAPTLEDICHTAPVDVWVGSLLSPEGEIRPVFECLRRIPRTPSAVVLAAGLATRLGGRSKVTLRIGGLSLVGRAVRAALLGGAHRPVFVVVGRESDAVEAALAEDVPPGAFPAREPWRLIHNAHPEAGIGSSLALGAGAAQSRDLLILLADQPFVTGSTIRRLLRAWELADGSAAVALGRGGGAWGPPAVLNRSLLPDLLCLTGDQGASQVLGSLRDRVGLVAPEGGETLDVDTAADLERARTEERGERV